MKGIKSFRLQDAFPQRAWYRRSVSMRLLVGSKPAP